MRPDLYSTTRGWLYEPPEVGAGPDRGEQQEIERMAEQDRKAAAREGTT